MAQPSEGKGIHQTAEGADGSPSRPAAAGDDTRVSSLRGETGAWVKACGFRTGHPPPLPSKASTAALHRPSACPHPNPLPHGRGSVARLSSADRRGRHRSCRGRSCCSHAAIKPKTTKGRWLSSTVPSLGQLQRSGADRNCFRFSRRDTSSGRRAAHPCGSRSGVAARSRCRTGRRSRSPGRASPARRA